MIDKQALKEILVKYTNGIFIDDWYNSLCDSILIDKERFFNIQLNKKYSNSELAELFPKDYSPKRIKTDIKKWCIANNYKLVKFNSSGIRSIIIQDGSINI